MIYFNIVYNSFLSFIDIIREHVYFILFIYFIISFHFILFYLFILFLFLTIASILTLWTVLVLQHLGRVNIPQPDRISILINDAMFSLPKENTGYLHKPV